MIRFVLVGIIVLLGIFMAICPKYAVKQEERENQESLVRMRKKGYYINHSSIHSNWNSCNSSI